MNRTRSRSRSRSPPPTSDSQPRRRSRSPRPADTGTSRAKPRPRRNDGGFKWKEKRRDATEDNEKEKRLERGYRKRSTSPRRDREIKKTGANSVEDKFGVADKFVTSSGKKNADEAKPPDRKPAPPTASVGEPMIIVHVNDRLGTKAAIPCLASDPIRLFKAQVAARIGREPHEILLKRQGERPFKDQLTLEDYGVSNGVQLDLEVDTGD